VVERGHQVGLGDHADQALALVHDGQVVEVAVRQQRHQLAHVQVGRAVRTGWVMI
jgi:hypothetical protein